MMRRGMLATAVAMTMAGLPVSLPVGVPLGLAVSMTAWPARAVQPDEMLADPVMEARARGISRQIRCPVCQGETIDDSTAPISRDLRLIIRERIVAGDSDAQVIDYVVARYGEFVLFDPPKTGMNLLLWAAGPLMLLAGVAVAVAAGRRRRVGADPATLTPEEEARLDEILKSRAD